MTKQILSVLLILGCLTGLSGCGSGEDVPENRTVTAEAGNVMMTQTAEYREEHANIALNLPEDWAYETIPLTEERGGIEFWHEDAPDSRMGLYYLTDPFGICGTGVTREELVFPDGSTANLYWETLEDVSYAYVFFSDTPGEYLFEAHYLPTEFWEEQRETILTILGTAVVGAGELPESTAFTIAEAQCPKKYPYCFRDFDYLTGQWTFRFYAVSDYILQTVVIAPDGTILESVDHSHGG